MSSPPCSISVEEEYQKYVSASNQPVLHITHIYTTNPDASDSSPAELSAAAKAVMVQQQKQQQQAKQGEGSTGAIRRSCRQRKRPRYFPPMDVRILAARRCRYKKAANPFVCSLFLSFHPPHTPNPQFRANNFVMGKRYRKN